MLWLVFWRVLRVARVWEACQKRTPAEEPSPRIELLPEEACGYVLAQLGRIRENLHFETSWGQLEHLGG